MQDKSLSQNPVPSVGRLPAQINRIVGRERQIDEIGTWLARSRILSLVGPGGVGKSRLSIAVGERAGADFPDGVWFVELAPLSDPYLVAQTVASALGIPEQAGRSVLESLSEGIRELKLLIILDNCEHVLETCAPLAATLLSACPQLHLIATSREPLRIRGERLYVVPPLESPADLESGDAKDIHALLEYSAVRLFVERASMVQPAFRLTRQNAMNVIDICRQLDGIPLAIELAAARARSMHVDEIQARLNDRFRLLSVSDRAAQPRQQTLRALIDWSYDLLGANEKRLFARLSVFGGSWTLEAAEKVASGEGIEDWEVLDIQSSLVDKSLIAVEERDGSVRYRLLETLREYAAEKLMESGELEQSKSRHKDYFLSLSIEAGNHLKGPQQNQWLETLETEHDNLRAALASCAEAEDAAQDGLQMAGTLWPFWLNRGHWSEGREHLERALKADAGPSSANDRARALRGAGSLATCMGDSTAARSRFEEALAVYRELDDRRGIAQALASLGFLARTQGEYEIAQTWLGESASIHKELGDTAGIASSNLQLGYLAFDQGDNYSGRAYYEVSLRHFRQIRDKGGMAGALNGLGSVLRELGKFSLARQHYQESLQCNLELGDRRGAAWALVDTGTVDSLQGDEGAARAMLEEGLRLFRELGDREGAAYSMEWLAALSLEQGDVRRAAQLWGAAAAIRDIIGAALPYNERSRHDGWFIQARAALSNEAFTAAWDKGTSMEWTKAVRFALGEPL